MNIDNMKGEFLYRALVRHRGSDQEGFALTQYYYRSKESVCTEYRNHDILWPVEEIDRGLMYIPAPEELQ